jgi:hypothetical protein
VHTFISAKEELAYTHDFEPAVYSDVELFIGAMENWVSGNEEWSFESDRYFGPEHLKIKETREVSIFKKVKTRTPSGSS